MNKRLNLTLDFIEETDVDGSPYTEFSQISVGEGSNLSREDVSALADLWAQSDWYWVGFSNAVISLLSHPDTPVSRAQIDSML